MDKLSTRPAQMDDIPTLAEYCYDRMALRQQVTGGPGLDAQALQAWQAEAALWLDDERALFLVVNLGAEILGGACAKLEDESAQLLAWFLDLHLRPGLSGSGQRLLADMLSALRARGVRRLHLLDPQGLAVEEAFWRAVGAYPQGDDWLLCLDGGRTC